MIRKGEQGFTLIEIILVIVLMGIAIPSLVTAVGFVTRSQINPIGTTLAATLAEERMEQVIGDKMNAVVPFANINNARYPADAPMGYNRSVDITCVTAADLQTGVACPTNYRRVQVTVQPVGVGPNVPNEVMVTVLTDY